jgi:hypothetical protein
MTVRLRPHHLLCMLTFAGKGYSPRFVAHFESVVVRLLAGQEPIEIVEGPDEICSSLETGLEAGLEAGSERHCTNASVNLRDEQAAESIARLLGHPIAPGAQFTLDRDLLFALRAGFADGTIRTACSGCQWKALCDEIAQGGFAASSLTFSELECIPRTSSTAQSLRPILRA